MTSTRHYSLIDKLLIHLDTTVKSCIGSTDNYFRENPAKDIAEAKLSVKQKREVQGLMRINHVGEVCAQALYQGQALTARSKAVKESMQLAAQEETDHLAWCEQRLHELESHTSYLNPLWYTGAFAIGVGAGIAGDKWNLGFVAETERQVVNHLAGHLKRLPKQDKKSRAILQQMQQDESHHATVAHEAGAAELPSLVKQAMSIASKLMTTTAYWV